MRLGFPLLTYLSCLRPRLAAKQPNSRPSGCPLVLVDAPCPLPALLPCRQRARPVDLVWSLAWELGIEEIVGRILQSTAPFSLHCSLLTCGVLQDQSINQNVCEQTHASLQQCALSLSLHPPASSHCRPSLCMPP